jgi:hypothetical protein
MIRMTIYSVDVFIEGEESGVGVCNWFVPFHLYYLDAENYLTWDQ